LELLPGVLSRGADGEPISRVIDDEIQFSRVSSLRKWVCISIMN
jgi:hypothetical protein